MNLKAMSNYVPNNLCKIAFSEYMVVCFRFTKAQWWTTWITWLIFLHEIVSRQCSS
jgi:hypothetical protein